jgi:voltage-gated potassium channel
MIKKLLKLIPDHSQIALIVSILLLIIFSPYYWDASLSNYFNFIFLSFILLSAILTLKKRSNLLKIIKQAGYFIIILTLIAAITDNTHVELVNRILFIIFFMMIAINLLVRIVRSKEVDTDVIFSAVAVYVLFGFCGAVLAAVIMFIEPAAYSLNSTYSSQFHQLLYFSFVTITSTGYGDVLPITPLARTLAIFLALFGQLYLTVIIGILIGKYLSGANEN